MNRSDPRPLLIAGALRGPVCAAPIVTDVLLTPYYLLAAAFIVSAAAGFSSLLRTTDPLTWRSGVATVMFSGIVGLTIALIFFSRYYTVDPYFLLGLCALSTLGGPQSLDLVIMSLQRTWLLFKKLPPYTDDDGKPT